MTDHPNSSAATEGVVWRRVNGESFEYAIQHGRFGDEFVTLLNGTRLRRPITDAQSVGMREALVSAQRIIERDYPNGQLAIDIRAALAAQPSAEPTETEVQDTWLVGGHPDLMAMSGSVESDRVIQLHFRRKATDEDRKWLLEAINAKLAAVASSPSPAATVETERLRAESLERQEQICETNDRLMAAQDQAHCSAATEEDSPLTMSMFVSKDDYEAEKTARIVSRLRNFAVWNNRQSHYEPVPLCKEAADEIEKLRRNLRHWREECGKLHARMPNEPQTSSKP